MKSTRGSQENVATFELRRTKVTGGSNWTMTTKGVIQYERVNIPFIGLPISMVRFNLTGEAGADVKPYFVRLRPNNFTGAMKQKRTADAIVPIKRGNRAEWTPNNSHVGLWNVEVVKGKGRTARVKHTSTISLVVDPNFVQKTETEISTLTRENGELQSRLIRVGLKNGELTKNLGVVSKNLVSKEELHQKELQKRDEIRRRLEDKIRRLEDERRGLQRRLKGMEERLSCTVCTQFNKSTVHKTHNMSDDQKSVTATACQSGGQISFLNGTLRDGIHTVEIKFDNCSGSFYRIGFIQEIRVNEFLGGQGQEGSIGALPGSWGYKFDGTKFAGNTTAVKYGCDWRNKTVLATVDFKQGTISFAVDGVDQGVAFTGVKGPLLACVQLCCSGKATVTRQTFNGTVTLN